MKPMWKVAGATMAVLFAALVVWVYASPQRAVSLKVMRFETNLSTEAPTPFAEPRPYVHAILCLTNGSDRAVSFLGHPTGRPFYRLAARDDATWHDESLVAFGMDGGGYRIIEPSQSVNFSVLIESPVLPRARGVMVVSVPYHVPLSTAGYGSICRSGWSIGCGVPDGFRPCGSNR
jgi:hypothetical protein